MINMRLLLLLCGWSSAVREQCPIKCQCLSSWLRGVTSVVVDCSNRGLLTIPTDGVPRQVTSFVLNGNFITEVPKDSFKNYRFLREIYLYKNFISTVTKEAFGGLRRLKELSLHSNRIRRIENGSFEGLLSLQKLYLFTNFIEEINPSTFHGLGQVQTLFLHENLLRFVPADTFMAMSNLAVLTLYRNYLDTLSSRSFSGLGRLAQLYLHQNKLAIIEPDAFKDCKTLSKLQLGNNFLANITGHPFKGLDGLTELFLDNNRLAFVEPGMFDSLRSLKKLVILGNRIEDIRENSFSGLEELITLSISGNKLRELRPGMFNGLPSLQKLFLQQNQIRWIEPFTFQGLLSVGQMYLFQNSIFYIRRNTFFGMFSLAELNLGVNNITGLEDGAFNGLPRLIVLQLNSNLITELRRGALSGLRNVNRIVLYFNKISFVEEGTFDGLNNLQSVVWYPPLSLVRTRPAIRRFMSNNLTCDCTLRWFKDWLIAKHLPDPFLCTDPVTMLTSNVTDVNDTHFVCDNGTISVDPEEAVFEEYDEAYLTCTLKPGGVYSWVHNGTLLLDTSRVFQLNNGILYFRSVRAEDRGRYTCIGKRGSILLAASSDLIVGVAPTIRPPSVEVIRINRVGEPLFLTCSADGWPPPLYIWYKDSQPVLTDHGDFYVAQDGTLIVVRSNELARGSYVCEARNEVGVARKLIEVWHDEESSACDPPCGVHGVCVRKYQCQCNSNQSFGSSCSSETSANVSYTIDGPVTTDVAEGLGIVDKLSDEDGVDDDIIHADHPSPEPESGRSAPLHTLGSSQSVSSNTDWETPSDGSRSDHKLDAD